MNFGKHVFLVCVCVASLRQLIIHIWDTETCGFMRVFEMHENNDVGLRSDISEVLLSPHTAEK